MENMQCWGPPGTALGTTALVQCLVLLFSHLHHVSFNNRMVKIRDGYQHPVFNRSRG